METLHCLLDHECAAGNFLVAQATYEASTQAMLEVPYGDAQDPLYVVIAMMLDPDVTAGYGAHAEAFLVNSSGQVLCTQSLKRFFKGFGVYEGKIIKVEEDKLGKKTMCSIVTGCQLGWRACNQTKRYILINTFNVEELLDVADEVREVLAKGSEAWPVEMEFP